MRVVLCHWKREECPERVERLRAAGFEASAVWDGGTPEFRALTKSPPDAILFDLARLPSHAKYTAFALRATKATRRVPLVFLEGEPEKVEAIRKVLPDATYTTWAKVAPAVRKAVANPPENPVSPESVSGTSKGTPLPKKLGVKEGSAVALVGAPEGFEGTLGDLPAGASTRRDAKGAADLTLWFVRSRKEYDHGLARMRPRAAKGGLWVCWPKKASGVECDLDERVIQKAALDAGLVDFKVCSVDATWSGLRFSIRAK